MNDTLISNISYPDVSHEAADSTLVNATYSPLTRHAMSSIAVFRIFSMAASFSICVAFAMLPLKVKSYPRLLAIANSFAVRCYFHWHPKPARRFFCRRRGFSSQSETQSLHGPARSHRCSDRAPLNSLECPIGHLGRGRTRRGGLCHLLPEAQEQFEALPQGDG